CHYQYLSVAFDGWRVAAVFLCTTEGSHAIPVGGYDLVLARRLCRVGRCTRPERSASVYPGPGLLILWVNVGSPSVRTWPKVLLDGVRPHQKALCYECPVALVLPLHKRLTCLLPQ